MLSVILATTLGIYLVWAEVLSDSLFHRVLSIALCLLAFLTAKLLSLPVSTFTISLIILTLLVFALCIALSLTQSLFYHTN